MASGNPIKASTSRGGTAALEQDRAAGGVDRRKLRIKSGEIVTVSLSLRSVGEKHRVILRFKTGGTTIQRPVGNIEAPSRFEALKQSWALLREGQLAEKERWSWIEPSSSTPN